MSKPTAAGLALAVFAVAAATAAEPKPETDEQKTLYALGLAISKNLAPFSLSADELAIVISGIQDATLGKETKGISLQEYQPKIQLLAQSRRAAGAVKEKAAAAAFLAEMAAEKGATKTDSGLIYFELTPGSGPSPAATDRVKVHYHGTLRDGTVFDSSVERGEPATFGLNQVIKCWTEGVAMMKVGGKSRLICPADIAYGDRGTGATIGPGAALSFEVELLEIVK